MFKARRSSRLLGKQRKSGFTSAKTWMDNRSYMKFQSTKSNPNSNTKANTKPKFKKVTPTNISRFQIWNSQQFTWNQKLLRQPPTLLKERDIIHWQNFRTQKLTFRR